MTVHSQLGRTKKGPKKEHNTQYAGIDPTSVLSIRMQNMNSIRLPRIGLPRHGPTRIRPQLYSFGILATK